MRTTLDIDEDVLITARQMAADEGVPIGEVISRVVRDELDRMCTTGGFIPSLEISSAEGGDDA